MNSHLGTEIDFQMVQMMSALLLPDDIKQTIYYAIALLSYKKWSRLDRT